MLGRFAGYAFVASFGALLLIWGYLPRVWVMGWPLWVCLATALLSSVLWALGNLANLSVWFKKRSTRFGLNLALTAIFTFVILGAVNWFAANYNKKKDFTSNKLHTLSEQTVKILSGLKEEITLRVWTTNVERMSPNLDARDFFENYKIASHGKLKLEIKNPNEDRAAAEKDRVNRDHLVIVKSASGREARVDNFSDSKAEEIITNGIIQAIKGGSKKTVCFLSGHGELALANNNAEGMSQAKQRLEESSYTTKEITLVNEPQVPAECEALVIAGPSGAPQGEELKRIQEYLKKGGGVLALMGPRTPAAWAPLTQEFGIKLRSDIIVDPRVNPPVAVATKNFAQDVEIVKSFDRLVLFPEASSIEVAKDANKNGLSVKTFVSSENYTFAKEGQLKGMTMRGLMARTKADLSGPLAVAVLVKGTVEGTPATPSAKPVLPKQPVKKKEEGSGTNTNTDADAAAFSLIAPAYAEAPAVLPAAPAPEAEKEKKKEMNLIFVSNYAFVANGIVGQMGNMDLFLNAVAYLARDADTMGIRPKEIRQAKLQLSPENFRQVVATVLLIAVAFVLGGIMAAARRRSEH